MKTFAILAAILASVFSAAADPVNVEELPEHRRRITDTARIYDVLCWMKRSKVAKIHMEKLRERKAAKAARRQRAATKRLFNGQ